ncbi:MAG: TraR/DksA C4-type zinc finger protein [Magnetococcales bacterium]|nr:TraR/DksA C4-type zinc finger protein [Magnetococcales bacterium]
MTPEPTIDVEQMQQRLLERKKELLRLSSKSADSRQSVELDQTRVGRLSRMDALQMQAMSQENERQRQAELNRITAALARIEEEEYGYCIVCDEAIADKRLALDPSLPTCIRCARKQEVS